MKPVEMKRTDADKKAEASEMGMPSSMAPDHPHGLKVRLESPELDKLGMTKLPAAGRTFTLKATAKVEHVTAADDGGKGESVSLVITHLAMEADGPAPDRGAKMYDKPAKAAPAAPVAPGVVMPPE